ncbi:MAG: UDP-N-acetylglucosamine pyrophosphorylase [Deltaproteobacteria bacterium]|nr:UDP-N-acetylglucosamine pyrophosphorylase [Deltaproteobacteria bacterium]
MANDEHLSGTVVQLMEKGVRIPNPLGVEIGDDIDPARISGRGVVLHNGTGLRGEKTLIGPGSVLGAEAPVTVVNCRLGPGVELKGGYFKGSVFLEKANMGCGAQVREGSILEEEANGAHTVGLKQTILFPFVTLGSLVNFCDCLMAGGTSRTDHSEVGSSYIHFNYTPNQDKATASLIGDVPHGVMLNQPPIFLGGQGGLVGPARIGFGTVISAGTVYRSDCPEGGKLLSGVNTEAEKAFHPGFYGDVQRRVSNNVCYLANLLALKQWYAVVRRPFFHSMELGDELFKGALETLDAAISERIKRFEALAEKMERSIAIAEKIGTGRKMNNLVTQKRELLEGWPRIKQCFIDAGDDAGSEVPESFRALIDGEAEKKGDYITVIRSLDDPSSSAGTVWLQSIVDGISAKALGVIPSFSS